jgi:4'-phosphopantetheinyl transferase
MEVSWLEQSAADVPDENDWLSVWEASALSGMRIPKRRTDWRLGRWTAKHAVATHLELPTNRRTLTTIEIRPAESGAPEVFFEHSPARVSISLSHRAGIGACAIAPAGVVVGCDLEIVEPRSNAFVEDYFTADEQALVGLIAEADRPALVALLWSAKESALKTLRTGLRLDTRCVAVTVDGPSVGVEPSPQDAANGYPAVSLNQNRSWSPFHVCHEKKQFFGWWQRSGDLVRTIVTVPALSPPIILVTDGQLQSR